MPTIDPKRLASSYLYYDAQADDARLTLEVIRTVVLDHNAVAVNGARVETITKDPSGTGHGAVVAVDGETIEVRADAVINVGGVWSDDVRAIDEGPSPPLDPPGEGRPHQRPVAVDPQRHRRGHTRPRRRTVRVRGAVG